MLNPLAPLNRLAAWVREAHRRNPVLTVTGIVCLGVVPLLVVLALVDPRTVTGSNPWLKPIKFSVSFGVYFLTLAWLLEHLPGSRRAWRIISWGSAAMLLLELPVICLQAARGVPSHFNNSSLFDYSLFVAMGVAAFTQIFLLIGAIRLFWKNPVAMPELYLAGIRWGCTLMVLGVLPALAMLINNQHAVGVSDGGAGLPLVNWSTEGGDYRIAHFVGMHGMQIFPLLGFWLACSVAPRSRKRARLIFGAALAGYLLVLIAISLQAMLGIPLIGW